MTKHKRLTGVARTNHIQKGQTRQEMLDEAPNANTSEAIGKVTKVGVVADWESWTEELDFYFLANGVKEPKTRKAALLTNLLVETCQLAKEFSDPLQLKDGAITYDIFGANASLPRRRS